MARAIKRSRYNAKRNEGEHVNRRHFVDLPVDVLFEIFLLLEPAELLYLARTTKGLRAFLRDRKKASAVWNSAISNVGLPPCPTWTSPPAYAFLAFEPLCHGCYRTCETIKWNLRMRCCPTCFPKMTTKKYCSKIDNLKLPVASSHYELRDEGRHIYTRTVLTSRTFSRSDWKFVRSSEWPQDLSLENFVVQQNEFWESVRSHANLCQSWEYAQLQKRRDHLEQARIKRVDDIKSKLTEIGCFQTVVSFCDRAAFWSLPEVKKFERLTPEEWTKIQPKLVRWLQEALCVDRKCALDSAILVYLNNANLPGPVKPQPVDVAGIPAVRSVIEPTLNIVSDISNSELMEKMQRVLCRAITKWSTNAVAELTEMAREELGLSPRSKPSILLPVIFRCRTCRRRLRFSEALSHEHLYKVRLGRSTRGISSYESLLRGYSTHPRNNQVLWADVVASQRVENLVRQLGQNPLSKQLTYDELALSRIKVVCNLCHSKVETSMDFKDAFKHCLDSHPGKKETRCWTRESGG